MKTKESKCEKFFPTCICLSCKHKNEMYNSISCCIRHHLQCPQVTNLCRNECDQYEQKEDME